MSAARPDTELPRLVIVPTASLASHEEVDLQRSQPLAERLRAEGVLKNPPVVAPIEGEQRYVVLDGTNRVVALRALACPHVVVQVVDYDDPDLILDTWSHLVTDMPAGDFLAAVRSIAGVRLEPGNQLHARAELARRQAVAYLVTPQPAPRRDEAPLDPIRVDAHVVYADGDLQRRAAILTRLVSQYRTRGRIQRVNTDHIDQLWRLYDHIAGLVVFPRYEPSEIMELARQGAYLPTGITRHVVPGRALRLNFPLRVLFDERTLLEKHAWLQDWLRAKLAGKEVRYYQESTFLFDE
ncbi:MAG TPA: ParB N-terminal domain-containing protein [Anaerolineae bacterium]|nr:ParB N-terminal domain-containing protein [Anaerolineae bacterium]